jgi:DNA-binding NarL/FixJ family response regulator
MPVRVLLADDHPVVRHGLRALLGTLEGIEVVAEAGNGDEAVREAVLHRPDVVLMDIRMPGLDGVEATRQIRRDCPDTGVLVLTMYDDDATVVTAIQAGARGYLLKGADQTAITQAIRSVATGQSVLGPGLAERVLARSSDARPPRAFPQLTDREHAILDLLADGRRTAEIAEALFLSPKTVSNHLTGIFGKLRVPDRSAAIIKARSAGLGTKP